MEIHQYNPYDNLAAASIVSQPAHRPTIRFHLAYLVLACVLPVWLIAGFLVFYAYESKRSLVTGHMLETARALSMSIDQELATIQAALQAFSTSPAFNSDDFAGIHTQSLELLRSYPKADIIVADKTGQQLVNSYRPFGSPLPKRNTPETVRRIFEYGKPLVSDLFFGAVTKRPLIAIDVPVFRKGQIVYDLSMTLPSDRLAAILTRRQLPPGWYGGILDSKGVVVARTRHPERFVGKLATPGILQAIARSPEHIVELTNLEGTAVFDAFCRSSASNWTVVIGIPASVAMVDMYAWLGWAIGCATILSLLGIALAMKIGSRIAQSIQSLVPQAMSLGSGEPVTDVPNHSIRETESVADALLQASRLLEKRAVERDLAEKSLRESEASLRTLFQAIPDLIWLKDPEGTYLACNAMFARFIGVSNAEIIGKTDYDFFDRELADFFREHDLKAIAAGKPSSNEEWITFADDGHRALLDTTKTPMFDAEGNLIGVLGIGHDITERKRAEEELLKLSSAIEQSPVSIVITDTQGTIEFVNPKFSQLTGYSQPEIFGKNPRILKSGMTPPETYRDLWETITSGRVWQGEFHNRKKNGEIFIEDATIAPVKNRQGEITSYIAIKEDITEQRNLESQLRQAQKMEAIGTLTGGIAHDFNNILSVIIGFGSILEMKMAKGDPLHDSVMQILTAADRAAKLTRSMLAFSRKQAIKVKPEKLNEIISALEKMLRRLIREDIELRFSLTEEALPILADAGQLEQVLLNLTTNAKDSLPTGGIITITTEPVELDESFRHAHGYGEPGRYALINFADNGTGMEESVRQRIFEPFFTTKEIGKGTGLGLAICYGIIKQHHGFISCLSEPGKGTTFRIYLPLNHAAAGDTTEVAIENLPQRGGTETILVAEDDPAVRTLTINILQEYGYAVIEAEDGAAAVAKFAEHPKEIHLCLFDMIMPKKSGRDAYAEIRKIRPDIKVLFMSGYQADSDLQQGADLMTKPVLPRELLKRIREVLDR